MKILILAALFLSTFELAAQDKIILVNGDTLNTKIIKKSNIEIEHTFPNESLTNIIKVADVHKIILSSGREEILNNMEDSRDYDISKNSAWKDIKVEFNPNKVKGMKKIKDVVGKSTFGGLMSVKGGKIALDKMKEEAYKNGGSVVLVTDGWDIEKDKPVSGYGRGVKVKGEIYK